MSTRGLGAAPSTPSLGCGGPSHFTTRTCLSPCFAQDRSQAAGESRGQPPHPSSFPPPQSLALLCVRKARTLLSGAPDPTAGKKKDNLEISLKKKKKTNLVCFSSNTYISQLWLIHSSKSSSILHPFLSVQTGTSIPISISTRGDGQGKKRGAFPRGRGLLNWWLDSEEQWAGFWLGGEGHLPGLTPPPNSPPPWLTGGPDIPQRPGCSALGVLSQRARLAEFKAR